MPADTTFDVWQLVAMAAALGWASGVRLYAVLFIVGGLGYLGWMPLPGGLGALTHPFVLAASGFMFVVEFLADKVPGDVDAIDHVRLQRGLGAFDLDGREVAVVIGVDRGRERRGFPAREGELADEARSLGGVLTRRESDRVRLGARRVERDREHRGERGRDDGEQLGHGRIVARLHPHVVTTRDALARLHSRKR